MIIFRIAETPATRLTTRRSRPAQTLDEVFAEVANMCGGTLEPAAVGQFPASCHVDALFRERSVHRVLERDEAAVPVASYLVTINHTVHLQATLCLCCSAPVEVADSAAATEAEQNVGELEIL
jgi:hypothetical protein